MAKIDFKKIDTYRKTFDGILQVKKHVNSEDDLPATGAQNGDIYTVGDSDTLYMFSNGEWGTLGSGGSTDWNDITNKPFYTKTFPSVDLPNGIKLVIDGYIKEGATIDETHGRYQVTDTRFDVSLVNNADNTVLEKAVGVIPEIASQTTSQLNMKVEIDLPVRFHSGNDLSLRLAMFWSELAAFNKTVRTWKCELDAFYSGGSDTIGEPFIVATPAKPSAIKGQDYDTVTAENSLEGVAYYKKPDEVKKIDNKYLPDPDSSVRIKGYPGASTTSSKLAAMGLTVDVIESVASGDIIKVLIGPGGEFGKPDLFNVIEKERDDVNGSWFACENMKFDAYGIEYTAYTFRVTIDISDAGEEIRYPQVWGMKHYRYEIQAEAEGD